MGFVHDEDFDSPQFTPQDIREATDLEILTDWLDDAEEARIDIKSQVEAAQLTGAFDPDWMKRSQGAYSFSGMAVKRIKRRMRELGHSPEPKDEVEALRHALGRQATDLGAARAAGLFGRCLLECVKEALPVEAANAILAEASKRVTAVS